MSIGWRALCEIVAAVAVVRMILVIHAHGFFVRLLPGGGVVMAVIYGRQHLPPVFWI